jgi:hypothetical protein
MEDRIVYNEISVRIEFGEDSYLFDPHYDTIHIYPWLGHCIVRIITDEGQGQLHTSQEYGESIAEIVNIEPKIEKTIGERAWKAYLQYQDKQLDDDWLE